MAIELQDTDKFDGTITNGGTQELEVKTATSNYVQTTLDDGTTGGTPPQYTIVQEYYHPQFDDYMEYSTATAQTTKAIREDARGARLRIRIENTSGSDATFRISVQTFEEI